MRQAQARKISDAYLDAPKRSERPHLHVVDAGESPVEDLDSPLEGRVRGSDSGRFERRDAGDDGRESPLRFRDFDWDDAVAQLTPDPAIADPDWAKPFADARWDDRLGGPDYEERDGRRTVLVTGRPERMAAPRRESSPHVSARSRRRTPTRARLAGRPDRVALWAVALGLIMAAMAGFSGNGGDQPSDGAADQAPAPLVGR